LQKTSKCSVVALLLGAVVFFAYGGMSFAQDGGEITKANWRQHPKIREVRGIYQSVNSGRRRLRIKKRSFEYCEPHEDTLRVIGTDAQGRVRLYQREGGSEDSSLKFEHYYDEAGRLRFVLITGGAVSGSKLEQRIYFDADGKRIWEEHSATAPGYTWPEVWPEDQLQISDPAAKFSSASPCAEIKARAGGRRRA
jgi:hypothetical protein